MQLLTLIDPLEVFLGFAVLQKVLLLLFFDQTLTMLVNRLQLPLSLHLPLPLVLIGEPPGKSIEFCMRGTGTVDVVIALLRFSLEEAAHMGACCITRKGTVCFGEACRFFGGFIHLVIICCREIIVPRLSIIVSQCAKRG